MRCAEQAGLQDASVLWNNLGYHLDVVADYAGAREAYEPALDILKSSQLPPDHPYLQAVQANLERLASKHDA